MLKYYGFEDKEDIIKKWYNGYLFGECNVYNPWSVDKFIYDLTGTINALPISYWANTSSNSIVKSLIEKADDDTKAQIEELVAGKTIEKVILKRYIIKSNRETGKGRSDIIIKYPNRRGAAVILELKVAKNFKEMSDKCDEALDQIEEKQYDAELLEEGYTNIVKYGITFYKKDCMIKKY